MDLSPTGEEWGVDQGMLNKLKEEYKKSRRNKGIDRRKYFPFVLIYNVYLYLLANKFIIH